MIGYLRVALVLAAVAGLLAGVSVTKTHLDGVYSGIVVCNGAGWAQHVVPIAGNTTVFRGPLVVCIGEGWLINATQISPERYTGVVEGLFVVKGGLVQIIDGKVVAEVGPYKVVHGRALVVDALVYRPR